MSTGHVELPMPTQRVVSKQSHCCSRDIHFTSNNTARGVNSILFSHKIGLNQDTGESLSVLWSDFMWDFNSLLEMKVASHRKHSKDPHDLWCIMTPCFVGNPFPHSKHWFENCWPQLCSWTWCKQKSQCTIIKCTWRSGLLPKISPHSKQS